MSHSSRTAVRRRSAVAAVSCALCLGVAAPMALATTPAPTAAQSSLETLIADGTVTWEPGGTDTAPSAKLENLIKAGSAPTVVVVTPGTDDTGLHPRVDGLVGPNDAAYVNYPESFGPIITGKADTALGLPLLAPGYQSSADVATAGNLAVMAALQNYGGTVVYTGYSQGSEALGNAAEQAAEQGKLGENSVIVLVSDPRGPWGLKGWAGDLPLGNVWLTPILGVLDIDNNGARDPGKTGDAQVVAVIVAGDPVADWQFRWYRPASSLLVNAAGFLAIHSQADGQYANLDELGEPTVMYSADGNTTYLVYDTEHPLALVNAQLYDALGIDYDADDLARWDRQAELFYKLDTPGTENTRGGVQVTQDDPRPAEPVPVAEISTELYHGKHRLEDQSPETPPETPETPAAPVLSESANSQVVEQPGAELE
ncbi:PE-PPE domain-containing protein [Gordonia alkaliphila]